MLIFTFYIQSFDFMISKKIFFIDFLDELELSIAEKPKTQPPLRNKESDPSKIVRHKRLYVVYGRPLSH
jgi:hypothetical protein